MDIASESEETNVVGTAEEESAVINIGLSEVDGRSANAYTLVCELLVHKALLKSVSR